MIDPYRMVVVNIISSLLLFGGILFYKFIYPKKRINLFFLLILISFLPVISIFRTGAYESGDFNIHIYRMMSFYDSLKEGILIPSWAAELNATYGNPLFIFNYSLPYYLISLFHFLGISFITSYKIYLATVFLLSGTFMYFWIKELTNKELAAFTASIFYLFNPYHLIDVHFRATLGESTIFALTPLLFFLLTKYLINKKLFFLISTSMVTGLLLLAHPLVGAVILAIVALYIFLTTTFNLKKKNIFLSLSALFTGVISSTYVWISFILYSSYTFPNPTRDLTLAPFYQLFYAPWRYGFLFQGPKGELALFIGYSQLFVVIIAMLLLIKKIFPKKIISKNIFWLFVFFSLVFLMSPLSKVIWDPFPIFWMLLPFGRLLLPTAIATSVIAGHLASSLSKTKGERYFVYILLVITIGSTILNWGHRRVIPEIGDAQLRQNVWISTVTESTTAYFLNNKWADINNFWFSEIPKKHLEIIEGDASVKELRRTSIKH